MGYANNSGRFLPSGTAATRPRHQTTPRETLLDLKQSRNLPMRQAATQRAMGRAAVGKIELREMDRRVQPEPKTMHCTPRKSTRPYRHVMPIHGEVTLRKTCGPRLSPPSVPEKFYNPSIPIGQTVCPVLSRNQKKPCPSNACLTVSPFQASQFIHLDTL